MDVEAEEA
jgi:hypothetical protein